MQAWRLAAPGGALTFSEVPLPTVRAGTVLVKMEAAPILTYLKEYIEGRLPTYHYPPGPFTPGTNGVGTIVSIGSDVWHFHPGQRVLLSPHILATDNVAEPAQVLSGLTGSVPILDPSLTLGGMVPSPSMRWLPPLPFRRLMMTRSPLTCWEPWANSPFRLADYYAVV